MQGRRERRRSHEVVAMDEWLTLRKGDRVLI